jgi:hypothetical protein
MCGNLHWEPVELIAAPIWRPAALPLPETLTFLQSLSPGPEAFPFLVIGCTRCFHTVLYAWTPIERGGLLSG